MNLWKEYLRWRHSKGFGVHSPYAYRFITDVLNPGRYGYYAYNQLHQLSRGQSIDRGDFYNKAEFLIRLAIFLHTKRIISYGTKSPVAQIVSRALKIVYYGCDVNSKLTFKPGDLLIIPKGVDPEATLINMAIENNVPVFALNPGIQLRNILKLPIKKGVLFTGKTKMLLIPREEMEYLSYPINL